MSDDGIVLLLEALQSPNSRNAWEEFLDSYSGVLYQTARTYTSNDDAAADCYLNICEQLAGQGFRRLLKFKRYGGATFTTWLRVVARNLCFDWHRKQTGRRRPFKSLQSLSQLELDVFDYRFERGFSQEETLQRLRLTAPHIDLDQLAEVECRIEHHLSSRQRWLLSTRPRHVFSARAALLTEEGEESVARVPDTRLDQESLLVSHQQQAKIDKCVKSLPPSERLLLQLRFERDLTLDEIARLTELGDAQRVHRHIEVILRKLRLAME